MSKKYCMPVYKLPRGMKLSNPVLQESAAEDVISKWFSGFKNEFKTVRSSWPELTPATPDETLRSLFANVFPDEVKRHVRYVGRGTTRIAFISDSNVCYKFQYNDYRNQSRQEIFDALAWPDLTCFPKLLDWSEDGLAMAYEVAEQPTRETFVDTFTQGPAWLADRLVEYAKEGESRMLDMMLESGILNEQQKKVIADLMAFQLTMWRKRRKLLEDIDHVDNWGLLYRNNQPVIIVTDFGL